jgi:tetratricopeptide (TPR) repeat protein
MLKNRKWGCLVALVALVLVGISVAAWRQFVVNKRAAIASAAIHSELADSNFVAARSALSGLADPEVRDAMERKIRVGELNSALENRDTGLLRRALGTEPEEWIAPELSEAADLELAHEAVQARDFDSYRAFTEKWTSRSAFSGQWILLEADQLLARKLPEAALKLLKSASLSGPEDALRHARLALLEAQEPWKAMTTLDQGLKADPRNADLLSFRAQIEEAAGRVEDARLDYVAAVVSERKNPLHRDILANFYLRYGDLAAAAETWRDAAEDTHLGVYALKSWFWSRVAGVRLSKPLPTSRQQGWREFIEFLVAAPDAEFWNSRWDASLARVRGGEGRPEVAWLRALEALRQQDFDSAAKQLSTGFPRMAERLWPNLALRLRAHLVARAGQDPRLPLAGVDVPTAPENAHPFIHDFSQWANRTGTPESDKCFQTWLARPTASVGILFASGWGGAALIVGNAGKSVPDPAAPEWFDYGYARSLLLRDGKDPARLWLESLPTRSSAADLLLAELQLGSGAVDQGLAALEKIASGNSPHASRASWTLALAELDRGNPAKARQITLAAPSLPASVPGKEILARIALAEGNRAESVRIYQELGGESADAMIFLSKEAFAARDFAQAKKWTGMLARRFPEQPAFRDNLLQIDAAEKLKTQ